MRIIPNQSEKRFVSRLIKNGQKPIRINSVQSEGSIRLNSNKSEPSFKSESNRIISTSDPFRLILIGNSVWNNSSSDTDLD